jgi:hypothetical protein
MNKRPEIPEYFSDKGPDDPKNVIGGLHARETAQRKRRPVLSDAYKAGKDIGAESDGVVRRKNPRVEARQARYGYEQYEAPSEVRNYRPFLLLLLVAFILLLVAILAAIIASKLPAAVTALQTQAATYATLPTLTPTTTPSLTLTPTYTFTPTPTPTLTPTPRATLTPSATPTTTPTPRPTSTQNYTATLQAAQAVQRAATESARVLATVTAMWWTATPTAMPVVILAPDEDTPPTTDNGAFLTQVGLILFCVVIVARLFRWMRGGEEEPEYADEMVEAPPVDLDAERLRQTIKPIREETAESRFEPYRKLFIAIARLDNFDCRSVAEALEINKDQAAAATGFMYEHLGALRYKGATPQTGYRLSMERDELIDRLQRLTRAPLPEWPCPEFRAPSDRQRQTEQAFRHRQTEQTEILRYGEDGKPIFK